ncbi:MAG: dihydroorotate dehydrogenase (quinone), partial [Opitutales bacterium]|nr:dihydroorotate dehydrogenase (quinone) [Opitutales bacterium]
MDYLYEGLLRPLFFRKGFPFHGDVEKVHDASDLALRAFAAMRPLTALFQYFNMTARNVPAQKPIELFGLKFPNRVGLAAGYDKQARIWQAGGALGFGHVEVGTVTRHSQGGNEKPRIFRVPEAEAAVNSMGFPNDGAEEVARRLAAGPKKGTRVCP